MKAVELDGCTFDFGGLGKDLPVSWEGALPFNSAGWGELVVDIE